MLFPRLLVSAFVLILLEGSQPSYKAEIEQWRHDRDAALKADDGWLTVAGLYWLKEGRNTLGTDPASDMVLPKGSATAGHASW
jgi:hypothetical protein